MSDSGNFTEFIEAGFRNLLRQLKTAHFRFARYGESSGTAASSGGTTLIIPRIGVPCLQSSESSRGDLIPANWTALS
jgi:hypothetical protein